MSTQMTTPAAGAVTGEQGDGLLARLREPTRPQWLSYSAAWLGWVLDGFDFCVYLMVIPDIAREFGISKTAAAGPIALTMLSRLLGGLLAGAAADRWGRRLPLMISIVWFALCNGAIGFAPTFWLVLTMRGLFGLGMGAEWTSGATLAMENWPVRSRGLASGVLQGSWAIGYILAAVAYRTLIPDFDWRVLFWVSAVPALLVIPVRIWVPESPEWLARKGKPKEQRPRVSLKGMAPSLIWGSIAMVFITSGYYAVAGQFPTLLSTELRLTPKEVGNYTILLNLGMLTGGAFCGWMMMRFGIRAAITTMMLAILPVLPVLVGRAGPGWLALGAYLGGTFGTGFTGVSPLLMTRLYPEEVRARAAGIVYHVGAVGAAFVTPGIIALAEFGGIRLSSAIWIVAAFVEVSIILCFWLKPGSAQLDPGGP